MMSHNNKLQGVFQGLVLTLHVEAGVNGAKCGWFWWYIGFYSVKKGGGVGE